MTDMPTTEQYHAPLSKLLEMDDLPKQFSVIQDAWRKLFCMNTVQPLVTGALRNYIWQPETNPWNDYENIKNKLDNFAKFWFDFIASMFFWGVYRSTGNKEQLTLITIVL